MMASDDEDTYPTWVGLALAVVTVFCWGSMFVPAKKFEMGDGKCSARRVRKMDIYRRE